MTADVEPSQPMRLEPTLIHLGSPTIALRLGRLAIRLVAYPVISLWARFPYLPWPYWIVDLAAIVLRPVRGVRWNPVQLANCRAELMSVAAQGDETAHPVRAVLYLHGGAFVVGGLNSHRRLLSRIVKKTGAVSLAVNYRKLPTHPVSAAIADALDGYTHLLGLGYSPSQIAIAGDSAGGFLVLATVLAARERGLGTPAALVCLAPLTERDAAGKLAAVARSNDPLFPPSSLTTIDRLIVSAEAGAEGLALVDGFCGAGPETLRGLPPTLIQVGSDEILRPDAEFAAHRLAAAGVPVELQIWDRQIHAFQIGADLLSDAARAVDEIAAFLTREPESKREAA